MIKEQFKDGLNKFINNIKKIQSTEDLTIEIENQLIFQIKELTKQYNSVTTEHFTGDHKKIIDTLLLKENSEEEIKKILLNFKKNTQETIDYLTSYIKSSECFDFTHGKTKESTEELIKIFGSIFGLELSKELSQKVKAENLGRILGYALSGLYTKDLKELEFKENEKLTPEQLDLFLDKINKSDITASYKYNIENNQLILNIDITKDFANKNCTRGPGRFDHFFINEETKTLCFGFSTSAKDITKQGDTFAKSYIAMQEFVNQEFINGVQNKYYGYKLEPFYFMFGRINTHAPVKGTQESGRLFLSQFPNINQKNRELLAQLPFYSLCQNINDNNTINKFNTLAKYNSFISGCDTLDIYKKQISLSKDNHFYKDCLIYFNKILDLFNSTENNFSISATGENDSLNYLNDVIQSLKNMSFFIDEITEEDYNNYFKPLNNNLKKLIENGKIVNNLSLSEKIEFILHKFSSFDRLNELIDKSKKQNLKIIQQTSFKDNQKLLNINIDSLYHIDDSLLKLLTSCVSNISYNLSNYTNIGSIYLKNFSTILNKINTGNSALEAISSCYSISNGRGSFLISKNSVVKNIDNDNIYNFIEKSLFLAKKDRKSNYYYNYKTQKYLIDLIKFIVNDIKPSFLHSPNIIKEIEKLENEIYKKINNNKHNNKL